jgi:hypothetical protein
MCNLKAPSPSERAEHEQLAARMTRAVVATREIADGYAFELDATHMSITDLARWSEFERRCCPFFDFSLESKMSVKAPDVMLLGAEWLERALLRAQLIEEGYDVVAIDSWPMPQRYRLPGMTPRLLVIDLQQLPDPRATLDDVRLVIPPERVVVLTAIGTLSSDEVRRFGFKVLERPTTVGQIVTTVALLVDNSPDADRRRGSPPPAC